jgi:hypothetical protein
MPVPRARHAVLPRGTPNSDDFFPYRIPTPHELEKKQRYDLLPVTGIPYLQLQFRTVLNNRLMTWARTCGDVSIE